MKPLAGRESRRARPHPCRAVGGADARRSRRRRRQGRAARAPATTRAAGGRRSSKARTASGSTPPISIPAIAASVRSRSISRSRRASEIVRRLAAEADVLIENFKTGGLAKYGLDYASLSALNPRLIYCSITGFGHDGPYAHRAGYDFIIQGMGGTMDLTGEPDGEPQKPGVAFADIFTGLYAVIAIQAALRRREITGRGAEIDMALFDTQLAVLANQAMNYLRLRPAAAPHGQRPSQSRALSGVRGRRRPADRRHRQRPAGARFLPHRRPRRSRRQSALREQRRPHPPSRRIYRRACPRRRAGCAAPTCSPRWRRRTCRPARSTRSPKPSPTRRRWRAGCGPNCRRPACAATSRRRCARRC